MTIGGANTGTKLAIADRRSQAVQLRIQGHTFREIAQQLGVSLGQVHSDVSTALAETRDRTADDCFLLRTIEHERLEGVWQRLAMEAENCTDIHQLVKLTTAMHRNSELRQRLHGLEQSKQDLAEDKLAVHVDELVGLLVGRMSADALKELMEIIGGEVANYDLHAFSVPPRTR
jgi:predicted trehalose synthase